MDIPKVVVQLSTEASLRGKSSFGKEEVRPVYEFRGVPYAQPPVGEGRFRPPKPLLLWKGEREAKKFGAMCPQSTFQSDLPFTSLGPATNVSEDCLFLNVYTPTLDTEAKLPVMVWIHGGAFVFGSGDIYKGTPVCSYHDVVVVSINYRLGVLGFMTTGDDVAPGNYGLLDQIEALRWVQKYIRAFGGNPDNVTIYGESAGGMSVSMLMMSDLARGLFKRAISQSGTANMPNFLYNQKRAGGQPRKKLAKAGFKSDGSREILQHLRSLPADELLKTMGDLYRPVVDGHVLKDTLTQRYRQPGGVANVDYLLGCNTHEGYSGVLMSLGSTVIKDKEMARQFLARSARGMGIVQDKDKAETFGRVAGEAYLPGIQDGDEEGLMKDLVDFYGDCLFVVAIDEGARLHSVSSPTYFYYFTHRPSLSVSPGWVRSEHAMDILYMMGFPLARLPIKLPFNRDEKELSKLMMNYWVNFARTGNPNGPGLPDWPQYTLPQRQHLTLDTKPTVGTQLRGDKEKFWRQDALPLMLPGLVSKY